MSAKKQSSILSFFGKPKVPKEASAEIPSVKSTENTATKDVFEAIKSPEAPQKRSIQNIIGSDSESEKENSLKGEPVPSGDQEKVADFRETVYKKMKSETQSRSVSYQELCDVFELIGSTTKRLQILDYLVKFFVQIIKESPESLVHIVYLCLNKLGPEYEGVETGLGESLILKAVAQSSGQNPKAIKNELDKVGDLGNVAQMSKSRQKTMFATKPLNVDYVFKVLKEIALTSGANSMQKKVDKVNSLLVACKGNETKYLVRSLEGKLRIGLAEQTVLVGLAHASILAQKSDADSSILDSAAVELKSVYNELPSYDIIVPALLEYGVFELNKHCSLTPGIPLKPMLAHPTKSLTEVLNRFEGVEFTCEYKYDGERAQIHRLENGKAMVFSRNSENLSEKYPDILARIPKIAKENTTSYVLDCEAVAWDTENKCILPFQILSTRKRKDVETKDIKVQVCIFAFDLLYLNGAHVTGLTLKERRNLLHEHFNVIEGEFCFAKHLDTNSIEEIQTFLDDSVVGNCEGLMVKTLDKDSTYEPSKRSRNWLKVKKDYLSGIGDTVDLVVIGAYTGRGKRTGWYGGYLLACYDTDTEEYQSICKIGTGFSEKDLAEHAEFFKPHVIQGPKKFYNVGDNPNILPDVWFEPVQVWEVKCADLSISPVHKAAIGLVESQKGVSLRFPRFIKIRDDKSPENATSASQIAEMYKSQQVIANNNNNNNRWDDE